MLTRGVTRRMGAMNLGSVYPGGTRGGYIDGEVVDSAVVADPREAEQLRRLPRGTIARRTDI
jgi:hypothetical protein